MYSDSSVADMHLGLPYMMGQPALKIDVTQSWSWISWMIQTGWVPVLDKAGVNSAVKGLSLGSKCETLCRLYPSSKYRPNHWVSWESCALMKCATDLSHEHHWFEELQGSGRLDEVGPSECSWLVFFRFECLESQWHCLQLWVSNLLSSYPQWSDQDIMFSGEYIRS